MTWALVVLLALGPAPFFVEPDVPPCEWGNATACLIPRYCWSEMNDPGRPEDTCPWVFDEPREG